MGNYEKLCSMGAVLGRIRYVGNQTFLKNLDRDTIVLNFYKTLKYQQNLVLPVLKALIWTYFQISKARGYAGFCRFWGCIKMKIPEIELRLLCSQGQRIRHVYASSFF